MLGLTYAAIGRYEEAVAEFHKIKSLGDSPMYLSWLGCAYGMAGRRAEAQGVLNRLKSLSKRTYVSPYWMTLIYTGMGDKDETFKWFERIFEEHTSGGTVSLKVNPLYDSLRSDPRFADLLRRVGLAQ